MDRLPTSAPKTAAVPDFEELSRNIARFVEEAGKATAAYLKPAENRKASRVRRRDRRDRQDPRACRRILAGRSAKGHGGAEPAWHPIPRSLGVDPQTRPRRDGRSRWPSPSRRTADSQDPEWSENPVFDFLKQAYLITTRWAEEMVEDAEGHRRAHAAQGASSTSGRSPARSRRPISFRPIRS